MHRPAPSRRDFLAAGGGLALAAPWQRAGPTAAGVRPTGSAGSGGSSGATIAQWYHQYGEAGTEQAVKRYAAAYKDADGQGHLDARRLRQEVGGRTADRLRTGRVRGRQRPEHRQIKGGQVVPLDDLLGSADE